jgi:hypothetical protein
MRAKLPWGFFPDIQTIFGTQIIRGGSLVSFGSGHPSSRQTLQQASALPAPTAAKTRSRKRGDSNCNGAKLDPKQAPEDFHKMCGKPCENRFFDRPNSLKADWFLPVCLKVVQHSWQRSMNVGKLTTAEFAPESGGTQLLSRKFSRAEAKIHVAPQVRNPIKGSVPRCKGD